MADESLIAYIKENVARGYTKEDLQDILVQNGWHPHDVADAIAAIDSPAPESALPELPSMIKLQEQKFAAPKQPETKPSTYTAKPAETKHESATPKTAEDYYVEPKKRRFSWKDTLIIVGMVLALSGVAYTLYILFWMK